MVTRQIADHGLDLQAAARQSIDLGGAQLSAPATVMHVGMVLLPTYGDGHPLPLFDVSDRAADGEA